MDDTSAPKAVQPLQAFSTAFWASRGAHRSSGTLYLCSLLAPARLPCQCCLPNPQPSSCGFQVSRDLTPTAVADSRKATAVQQEYRATTASPPPPSPPSENVCVCGRRIRHREVGETGSLLSSGRRDSVLASSSTHARRLHSVCPRSLWNTHMLHYHPCTDTTCSEWVEWCPAKDASTSQPQKPMNVN